MQEASTTVGHSRVFVLDPDEALRENLSKFLVAAGHEVQSFATVDALRNASSSGKEYDCLITELMINGFSGIDLQQELYDSNGYKIPIIFISEHADVETAVKAIQSGASGFLTKPFSKQVLLENLRDALKTSLVHREKGRRRAYALKKLNGLSRREGQVLDKIVSGMKNKEIAADMHLSLKTVEMHRARLMKKMGVENVVGLVNLYNDSLL